MLKPMITLAATHTHQQEIKKSRFIAFASPAGSVEEALQFVTDNRDPKATHNTWAYKVGPLYRFDDDGEVGGTAGRQILSVIEKQGLDQVVVIVIRYYGGIKLGTGGLVRAYSSSASRCLDDAQRLEILPKTTIRCQVPFPLTGAAYNALNAFCLESRHETHTEDGLVLVLEIEESQEGDLKAALVTASRGQVLFLEG